MNKPKYTSKFVAGENYTYSRTSTTPIITNYKLHTHNAYEIYIFLSGNAEYIIDSKTFPLKKYDIMVTKSDEMHQVRHLTNSYYERVVIELNDDFLQDNNCMPYRNILCVRNSDEDNMISPSDSEKGLISNCISRIESYIDEYEAFNDTIIKCCIIEILHMINNIKRTNVNYIRNKNIDKIIKYINTNLSNDINLDDIAKDSYLSKYHLCRVFKEHTGITINKYIISRRIMLVKELYSKGYSLTESSMRSGFSSYSSFYKAYYNETGLSPKKDIKNYNLIDKIELNNYIV